MLNKTLYVSFRNHQVAVQSNIPEVTVWIEHSFYQMLECTPSNIAKYFTVLKKSGKYFLQENDDSGIENSSLHKVLLFLNKVLVHHLIKMCPDLLWLHAGAAVYRDQAVIFSGGWGRGKSTLVTSLCDYGWSFLSDDIVPLDPGSGKVIPFLQTPTVREDPGREVPLNSLGQLRKVEVDLKQKKVGREPVSVGAIVFPVYNRFSSTRLLHCSASTAVLELLKSCLNFEEHKEGSVRYLCSLLNHLPSSRLIFSNGRHAAGLIARTQKCKVGFRYINS